MTNRGTAIRKSPIAKVAPLNVVIAANKAIPIAISATEKATILAKRWD